MKTFREFMKISEDTNAGDIAPVETILGRDRKDRTLHKKGKLCKKHKEHNCDICEEEKYFD